MAQITTYMNMMHHAHVLTQVNGKLVKIYSCGMMQGCGFGGMK